jgi:hypothetical protein
MISENDILKRILLNMKYDSSMTLNENYDLLVEQTTKVGKYIVTYDNNRVKIDSPSGGIYYWFPDGKWHKLTYNLGNEEWKELTGDKNYETLKVLKDVLIKSGIGSAFWIKNQDQGNKFRSWVIQKDPQFAKEINLNPQGPYDNEYIRKAWAKYGREYAKVRKSQSPEQKGVDSVISQLKQKGLDGSGAISENQAYALAAIRATKKLTDKIQQRIVGAGDSAYSVCVKKVGSTCPPGAYMTVDSFNLDMANKINSKKDENAQGLKPPQYTFLTNFYFDWGKIQNDLNNAFKLDKNAYKSSLFPDGWWNWFTTYWGTDNLSDIQIADYPKLVKVPGWKGGYPSGELTSSDVHTFLTVVELGAMLLAFIPSPLSPVLWGISTAAGLADSATYLYEGDKYMASMMLAFEVLPGGELLKFFKGSKTALKLGKEKTLDLIKRGVKGVLGDSEKIVYQNLKKELKSLEKQIVLATKKQIGKKLIGNLTQNFINYTKNMPKVDKLKVFYQLMATVWKKYGRLPKMVFRVGATAVGTDWVYVKYFGRDEDRQNSDFRKIYYAIQGKEIPDDEINRNVGVMQEFIAGNGDEETAAGMLEFGSQEDIDNAMKEWFNSQKDIAPQPEIRKTNYENLFGKLETEKDVDIELKPKTTKDVLTDFELEKLEKEKDNYDFYIWSDRLKKWNLVSFDEYVTGKEYGYQVNYTSKLEK